MDRRIFLGGMVFGASGLLAACGGDGDGDGGSPGNPGKLTKAQLAEVFGDYVGEYYVYPNFWRDGKYTGKGDIGSDFDDCEKYKVELKADGTVVIRGNGNDYTFGPNDLIEDKSEDVGYEIYVNFVNEEAGIAMMWHSSSGGMDKTVSPDDGFSIAMGTLWEGMGETDQGWANQENSVGLYLVDMMDDGACSDTPV